MLAGFTTPVLAQNDILAYSDDYPVHTLGGASFANPFFDGPTRIRVEAVPGLSIPRGSTSWSSASWRKYVFMTNYEEGDAGYSLSPPFPAVADQRIGVFETESRKFCELDIDPSVSLNAAVQTVVVASPTASKSRLYFTGFVPPGTAGPAFGYVEADLQRDPCVPYDPSSSTAGWRIVTYTADELVAKTDGVSVPYPCKPPFFGPGFCQWDGLGLLDPNTVIAGNWGSKTVVAIRVDDDPTGTANRLDLLHVPAVHVIDWWQPGGANTPCYQGRPTKDPATDLTRPANDRRATFAFDVTCTDTVSPPDAPATCPSRVGVCEQEPWTAPGCISDVNCQSGHHCVQENPGIVCSGSQTPCIPDSTGHSANCSPSETCTCSRNWSPAQEYAFNGTTITPTSPLFTVETGASMRSSRLYDSYGNLWLSEASSVTNKLIVFTKRPDGTYTYSTAVGPTVSPDTTRSVAPDQIINVGGTPTWNRILSATQVGNSVFYKQYEGFSPEGAIKRVGRLGNVWWPDAVYTVLWGWQILPRDPVGPPSGCDALANSGSIAFSVTSGGSPASLWLTPEFYDFGRLACGKNSFLIRVPVATEPPDNVSGVRPGVAWSGPQTGGATTGVNRLWSVAEHGGILQLRIRDAGLWSTWAVLPTNVILTGGAAVISNGTTIEVFARGSDKKVYYTSLTSPLTCTSDTGQPTSCTWNAWQAIPNSVLTVDDPAVAYQGTSYPHVVVRRESDRKIFKAFRFWGVWQPWVEITGMTTSSAPAIAWNANESRFWIAAIDST